jgi:hypothetical protein
MWRVAAEGKGLPYSFGGWARGLHFFALKKKKTCHEIVHRASELDSLERPRQRKMDVTFGTCNVTSLYRAGLLKTVRRELANYNLVLVAVQEVRWVEGCI